MCIRFGYKYSPRCVDSGRNDQCSRQRGCGRGGCTGCDCASTCFVIVLKILINKYRLMYPVTYVIADGNTVEVDITVFVMVVLGDEVHVEVMVLTTEL